MKDPEAAVRLLCMRTSLLTVLAVCLSAGTLLAAPRKAAQKSKPVVVVQQQQQAAPEAAVRPLVKPPTHHEFDGSELNGQSAKSGAIYVVERKETALRSLLRGRKGFRAETLGSVD